MSITDSGPLSPYIGALLRIAHDEVWRRMLRDMREAGFDDLGDTEYRVFQYPGPDGARPGELAERCGLTKQAMNYVLANLERKRYLERQPGRDGRARVVRLAPRGAKLRAALRTSIRQIERQWAKQVGDDKLEELRAHLMHLAQGIVSR